MASANEQAFLCAALPDRFRILGVDLLPFSVGHHMLLLRMGNRFVATDEKQSLYDLVQALFVCSRLFSEGAKSVRTTKFSRWLVWLRINLWIRFHLPARLQPRSRVSEEYLIGQFADYILAHSTVPDLAPANREGARDPGTPFIQFVIVTLMAKLNHSLAEAMNKPWGLAVHDVFAYWELEGKTRITSEGERDLYSEHERLLKQLDSKLEQIERDLNGPV